ncbi:glycosyltransferase family protein [Micromonospora haikouensis]|uniref:glycosyltransferase family protein n=1 Tax=Micromonospora haikouensis TaxID=686309 RepID=UPI003D7050D3
MEPDAHPRVLVVTALPFSRSTGGGITSSNLFAGWPRDRLAQLHTEDGAQAEVCERFFRLPLRQAPVEYHLRRLLQRQRGQGPASTAGGNAGPAEQGAADQGTAARAQLHAAYDLSPLRVPHGLGDWLRDFRPDVVYCTLGTIRLTRLALLAARRCRTPMVPHFMDDWPATLYADGELGGLARRALHRGLSAVLRRSAFGLGISAPMAEEYRRRYGIPFTAFANSVADSELDPPAGRPDRPEGSGTLELVYVGALHLDRWESLLAVADAVDAANRAGRSMRLTLHVPEKDRAWYGPRFAGRPAVRVAEPLADADVPAVLRGADILLHVESFAEAHRRYARYSLSTKLPRYLAAGRPILGYGPAELASMWHIEEAGAGLVVGAADQRLLLDRLTTLATDGALRAELARAGHAYAARHHHRARTAAAFAEVMRRAAGGASLPDPVGAPAGTV